MTTSSRLLDNIPEIRRLREQRNFASVSAWVMNVDFEGCRQMYWRAQMWCRRHCQYRWRCEPRRLRNESTFHFEDGGDAARFERQFPVRRCG
jgi:hypothetical protein